MDLLTSRENPDIKRMAGLLSSKKLRDREEAFACEGARLVLDGVKSGRRPVLFCATEQAMAKYPALMQAAEAAERASLISEPLANRLAETDTTQGVYAVFKKLDNRQTAVTIKSGGPVRLLFLVSVRDPGNVGAILRSCEAMGVTELILSADCADLYSPKTLRAGMGGIFRQPVRIVSDVGDEIASLRGSGVETYAAALRQNAVPLGAFAFPVRAAVIIGNEGNGLPADVIDACDNALIIPMAGEAESLNAAVAAGILIWELTKQGR